MGTCDSRPQRAMTRPVASGIVTRRRRQLGAHTEWEVLLEVRAFGECFPGGKMEPGETPAQAACRELREELGIRALTALRVGEPAAHGEYTVHHFLVPRWNTTCVCQQSVRPREGQTIVWVPLRSLSDRPLAPSARAILPALCSTLA